MKSICRSDLDIISDLPSRIIENILICLSLRDAARTSVLSMKWRYQWVTIPELIFNYQFCKARLPYEQLAKYKLMATIYQVLVQHKGPITKFVLTNPVLESCVDINHWISFLRNNEIQDFTLSTWKSENHKLPLHFYSFLQLRHLNLRNCVFQPPPTFRGCRLVSLELHDVILATDMFGNFISSCPLLETLDLSSCNSVGHLEIYAPNLKTFYFSGVCKAIYFKSTPLLAKVTIFRSDMAEMDLVEGETSNLIKVFGGPISYILFFWVCLKFLAVGNALRRLPFTLKHLRKIRLLGVSFERMDEISCLLCLIRSSPNLQKLTILAAPKRNVLMGHAVEYLQKQDFLNCSPNKLRVVNMLQISGVKPEMEFIRLILANATALEKMRIEPFAQHITDGGLKMLEELVRFPRASPKAESYILICAVQLMVTSWSRCNGTQPYRPCVTGRDS